MASVPMRDPVGDHLPTPQDAALVVIDYQPSQFAAVRSMDLDLLREKIVSTVKTAESFGFPIVHSTVNITRDAKIRPAQSSHQDSATGCRDRADGTTAEAMTATVVADPKAREFLRNADPVLARLIDAHPDFHPRAWIDELPGLDAFATLIFQVAGQQLSVRATRTILSRLEEQFGGHLPSPAELLAADPQVLRASGLSTRKGETLRALAERFVDGRLSDAALASMSDDAIEAALTEVSGVGPWTARGFLIFALDRPDVLLSGDLPLRHAVQRLYGLDHLPTEGEMVEVSERWRPYRSLAVSYLFVSEFEEPR